MFLHVFFGGGGRCISYTCYVTGNALTGGERLHRDLRKVDRNGRMRTAVEWAFTVHSQSRMTPQWKHVCEHMATHHTHGLPENGLVTSLPESDKSQVN